MNTKLWMLLYGPIKRTLQGATPIDTRIRTCYMFDYNVEERNSKSVLRYLFLTRIHMTSKCADVPFSIEIIKKYELMIYNYIT